MCRVVCINLKTAVASLRELTVMCVNCCVFDLGEHQGS